MSKLCFDFSPLKKSHVVSRRCSKVSTGFSSLSVTSQTITVSYQVGPELAIAASPPPTYASSAPATLRQAPALSLYIAALSPRILFPPASACFPCFLLSYFYSNVNLPDKPLIILPFLYFIFHHSTYLCICWPVCCLSPFSLHENMALFCSVLCPLFLEQSLSCSSHSNIVAWIYELLIFYNIKGEHALCVQALKVSNSAQEGLRGICGQPSVQPGLYIEQI